LTYPLIKSGTALYGWGMQRRIFLIYGRLNALESELDKLGNKPPTPEQAAKLRELEERANRVRVSTKFIPLLYNLKDAVAMVG